MCSRLPRLMRASDSPLEGTGTGADADPLRIRRRSGRIPLGRNQRKRMMSRPIATHSSAGTRAGFESGGINRVASSKPRGTKRAPRIAPLWLPAPPTMMAAKRTIVSAYPQAPGAQRLMKPTRTAPLSPAIIPPRINIDVRWPRTFLPSESATTSLSRMALSDRP